MLTNAQASSRCRASRFWATSSVSIGESIEKHDALFMLQQELPHGTWRVEQMSSDTFQTNEVRTCCFPDCTAALLASECNVKVGPTPDMPVSLTLCGRLVNHRNPILLGQVVYSAWRRLGSSVVSPLVVQALPLPVPRVAGQLPT